MTIDDQTIVVWTKGNQPRANHWHFLYLVPKAYTFDMELCDTRYLYS